MLHNTTEFDISFRIISEKGIHGEVILIWALKNCDGRMWTGFIWLRTRTSCETCIKWWQFLTWMSNY
jgi:hypothetical protein